MDLSKKLSKIKLHCIIKYMKISFLQYYDSPFSSSRRTYSFAKEFAKYGHQVAYVTNNFSHHHKKKSVLGRYGVWMKLRMDGVDVYLINTIPYRGNGLLRLLSAFYTTVVFTFIEFFILKSKNIIFSNVPLVSAISIRILGYSAKRKCILEIRDIWPDCFVDIGVMSAESKTYCVLKYLERVAYEYSDAFVVTMKNGMNYVAQSLSSDKPAIYIPNPVDSHANLEYKNRISLNIYSALKVVYVGGFGVDHNVISIINAAAILEEKHPGRYFLEMYGDGVNKEKAKKYMHERNIKNVVIQNPLDPSEVQLIQASAAVLVSAVSEIKSYAYGINSNKILSYLKSGPPVVLASPNVHNPIIDISPEMHVLAGDDFAFAEAIVLASNLKKSSYDLYRKKVDKYLQTELSLAILAKNYLKFLENVV